MNATLYLPGHNPLPVILAENTPEAAARLLGVPAAVVFRLNDAGAHYLTDGASTGWCDYHGRILVLLD